MRPDLSSNLTLEHQIVRPVTEVNPLPGHDLVVFERVGAGGHRFHSILRPSEELRGGLLARLIRPAVLVAYAVSRDGDMRHEFTREVTTWDRAGDFTLRCTLTLAVADARLIVEQLASDPLRRLEKMAGDLFRDAASRVDWMLIENLGVAFERQVLESKSIDAGGARASNLSLLRTFAARRGFELRNIDLAILFSPEFGEVIRRRREEYRRREVLVEAAATERLELELSAKMRRIETQEESLRSLITSSGRKLEQVLGNIADGVSSPNALRNIAVELMDTFGKMTPIIGGPEGVEAAGPLPAALRERVLTKLSEATVDTEPAVHRASEVAALVAGLNCAHADRQRLLSATFHLLGELLLRGEADSDALERYRCLLQGGLDAILPAIKAQCDHELLFETLNLKSLDELRGRR